MNELTSAKIRDIILLGKERGYLTYEEVIAITPEDVRDPEQIEAVISMFKDMGIEVRSVIAKGP